MKPANAGRNGTSGDMITRGAKQRMRGIWVWARGRRFSIVRQIHKMRWHGIGGRVVRHCHRCGHCGGGIWSEKGLVSWCIRWEITADQCAACVVLRMGVIRSWEEPVRHFPLPFCLVTEHCSCFLHRSYPTSKLVVRKTELLFFGAEGEQVLVLWEVWRVTI